MPDSFIASPHADTVPSGAESGSRSLPREEPDRLVGHTLGHFRLDARIGRGGMGAVYRAWDSSLEREVALKVLLGASDASRERFLREARVQAKLRHPNVVPIHFVGQSDDVSFLVMDIIDGESLADLVTRAGTLSEAHALDVANAIALALEAGSSAGLVHRDVKPSNILIDKQNRVMLADFGLAKTIEHKPLAGVSEGANVGAAPDGASALTHAGAIMGTPMYLAPEQARGLPVDFRADMYSLGVTLYEALTGQPPFTGTNSSALLRQHVSEAPISPRLLVPSVRAPVEALVMRLLAKDPAARFASYAELREAIDAARAKAAIPATFFVRLVAFAVDAAIMSAYAAIVVAISHSATIGWLFATLSFAALERVWSTPGKKLLRLRVVDDKGDPPSWAALLARSLLRFSGALLLAVDADVVRLAHLHPSVALDAIFSGAVVLAWSASLGLAAWTRTLHERVTRTRTVFV